MTVQARPLQTSTNAFSRTMVELDVTDDVTHDLFSRSVRQHLRDLRSFRWTFPLTQVFEPEVLDEAALLRGLDPTAVRRLDEGSSTAQALAEEAAAAADEPAEETLCVAAALVSVSRFELAREVLRTVDATAHPRAAFERAMLEFVIANRTTLSAERMTAAFRRMQAAARSEEVPRDRLLDACAQAVVWYLKCEAVPRELFEWFSREGQSLVTHRRDELGAATVSSWYRGIAMVPAGRRDADLTRRVMRQAGRVAEEAIAQAGSGALELTLRKTYHESSVKEYLYVSRDQEQALYHADQLVDLDPAWSVSHGEKAEVCRSFRLLEQAAENFDAAATVGPPYVRHHLLQAARAWDELGEPRAALERYDAICAIGMPLPGLLQEAAAVRQRVHDAAVTPVAGRTDTSTFDRGGR